MVPDLVRSAIHREFVSRFIPVTLAGEQPEWAAKEIERHVDGRFNEFQQEHIPWLEVGGTLAGCEVLEIGCGTGSSTAALCLAGAKVHAIDMDAKSVEFAALRCELMELNTADFAVMNATEIASMGRALDREHIIRGLRAHDARGAEAGARCGLADGQARRNRGDSRSANSALAFRRAHDAHAVFPLAA